MTRRFRLRSGTFLALLLICVALPMSGCGGCNRTPVDQKQAENESLKKQLAAEKEKKEKPKPDFEFAPSVTVQPADPEKLVPAAKPGHWSIVTRKAIANNFDFVGSLDADLLTTDTSGNTFPLLLEQQPYSLRAERNVALPKGSEKYLDQTLFFPRSPRNPRIDDILNTQSGTPIFGMGQQQPVTHMPAYQYYFVILAREPSRYQLFARKDPLVGPSADGILRYYQVSAPRIDKYVPLPSNALAWTSTAYVLWDDIDPSLLTTEQREAMTDWLHWGGQLIVSGPDTLSLLHRSPLDEYLPATPGQPRSLSAESFASLVAAMQPAPGGHSLAPLPAPRSWAGVALRLRPCGHWLPDDSSDLIAECAVGRGRIVVTGFRLNQRDLINWPGFDSLLNSCLLRHPARRYVDTTNGIDHKSVPLWADRSNGRYDPRLTCGLRYLSRDLADNGQFEAAEGGIDSGRDGQSATPTISTILQPNGAIDASQDFEPSELELAGSGIGGWNDFSAVPSAARDALRSAAGITIPNGSFVAWMLIAYLGVLGPLNWVFFRTLGRIEWAWIAAPLIAVVGAIAVTKAAHLNIGFARSQSEIDVVELQPNYSRAHLTRYTAVYTSLSTGYEVRFDDPQALVQPFALGGKSRIQQSERTVTLHRDADVRLTDFEVSSNSTAMLHSEQMIDFGVVDCSSESGRLQIHNRSKYGLKHAGVVRRTFGGGLEAAGIGDFAAGSDRDLDFQPVDNARAALIRFMLQSDPASPSSPDEPANRLNLTVLARRVLDAKSFAPGEMRLVGQMDEPWPGMEVTPQSSQATRAGVLVVANLQYALLPPPEPDVNLHPPNSSPAPTADAPTDATPAP